MVDGKTVGEIGCGVLALVGVADGDTAAEAEALARKMAGLRIFPDDDGKMNRSVLDVSGAALIVSQFTLLADVARGRRPSFTGAAAPDAAEPLIDLLCGVLRDAGVVVAAGRFGAHMEVESVNDGPVTILVEVTGDG